MTRSAGPIPEGASGGVDHLDPGAPAGEQAAATRPSAPLFPFPATTTTRRP